VAVAAIYFPVCQATFGQALEEAVLRTNADSVQQHNCGDRDVIELCQLFAGALSSCIRYTCVYRITHLRIKQQIPEIRLSKLEAI
jgi:hypothetical protein